MTSAYSSRILSVFAASIHLVGASRQVISKQRVAAGAVDQDVSRFEHRDRVFGRLRRPRCAAPDSTARVDQIADGALDGIERAETQGASPRRSAIRSEGIDCLNARPSSSSVDRRSPRRYLHRWNRHGRSRLSSPRGTVRAEPSGFACTRAASHRGRTENLSIDWSSAVSKRPTGPAPTTCTRPEEGRSRGSGGTRLRGHAPPRASRSSAALRDEPDRASDATRPGS